MVTVSLTTVVGAYNVELTLTVTFDPADIGEAAVTDALNEALEFIALELDLEWNERTGGYIGLDWVYDERGLA